MEMKWVYEWEATNKNKLSAANYNFIWGSKSNIVWGTILFKAIQIYLCVCLSTYIVHIYQYIKRCFFLSGGWYILYNTKYIPT